MTLKRLKPGDPDYTSYEESGLGRPSTITVEGVDDILTALRATGCISLACNLRGISRQTFYNWITKGKQEQKRVCQEVTKKNGGTRVKKSMVPYVYLLDNVPRVMAEAEACSILRIRSAGQGQPAVYDAKRNILRSEKAPIWQADAWLLERMKPNKYGRPGREQVVTKGGGGSLEEGADLQELRRAAEEIRE